MSEDVEALPFRVFDLGWEQRPGIDECLHEWRTVPYRVPGWPVDTVGYVDQCLKCESPRCPRPECIERRHHPGVHIDPVAGTFEPVGGYLRPEPHVSGGGDD